jgi:RNA polymerase sigma-70 factor (ECF subfamily)
MKSMEPDPLADLLEKLHSSDPAAAEEAFRAYEPHLRLVVRRHLPQRLRAKFDSLDVVQSVWADVLDGFGASGWRFTDADHLRAFLVTLTRRRLTDRLRHFRTALERERHLAEVRTEYLGASPEPRPSEVAQANDLWEKMLALCPPAHHEVLRLRREGLRLEEIAARTGFHEGSVRRILRKLARQMAFPGDGPGQSGEGVVG